MDRELKILQSKISLNHLKQLKKTGTGLGLSISKNLAKKMGGNLYYDSKYCEGAAFELVIPLANDENINN